LKFLQINLDEHSPSVLMCAPRYWCNFHLVLQGVPQISTLLYGQAPHFTSADIPVSTLKIQFILMTNAADILAYINDHVIEHKPERQSAF